MKSAGMIRKRIGKRIFTGAFCARSSAYARCRFRSSIARFRMIWPVETPIVSPWEIERENIRTPGVSTRIEQVLERLDEREAHVLLLQRQANLARERLADLPGGETERLRKAEPASSVTTRRSIRSGRARSTWSRRFLMRCPTMNVGSVHPSTAAATLAMRMKPADPPRSAAETDHREHSEERREELRPEEALGRRRVHAGRDQPGAVVGALEPRHPATERSGRCPR